MAYLLHLIWRHLRQQPGRALAAFVALTLAATLMLAVGGVGAALQFRVGGYLQELFPSEQVRLEAASASIGMLAMPTTSIDAALLAKLKADPAAQAVWTVQSLRFPVIATGSLFGQDFNTDVVVQGVPRELVADALAPAPNAAQSQDVWRDVPPGEPIPVILPTFWVDLFNLGYSRAYGLPQLNAPSMIGRHFRLIAGASVLLNKIAESENDVVNCVITGFTHNPAVQGVAIPEDAVARLNAMRAQGQPPNIAQLVVLLASGASRDAFIARAQTMGLQVSQSEHLGERLKAGVGMAGAAVLGLAAGIFALGIAMFYLMFTLAFHARRLDLMRMRALGMEPIRLMALAVGEAGAVALPAVAAAWALVYCGGRWLADLAEPYLARVEILPPHLLEPAAWPLVACAALILALALAPALPALRWALRTQPGAVLRDL